METKLKILNRHRAGDAIRKICRDLNLSRNTVREIIRKEDEQVVEYVREVQPYPALGEYIEPLEQMLRDNKTAKPKRTIKQLIEELVRLKYSGSESAVYRYCLKWRKRDQSLPPSACVPLSFAPGEAYQFDWSTDKILIDNEIITVKVAHFVLCYSRKKFSYIYPNETQEMVANTYGLSYNELKGVDLWAVYIMATPRRRLKSEKKYETLTRVPQS